MSFMETTYEEALQKYMDMRKEHVGEHLSGCEDFWRILRSEEAVRRFVPSEWEGIKGFEPLQ